MSLKISGGVIEDGVVIGNNYDKYASRNPIVKWMMRGFESALSELVTSAAPESIHEVGCGEGHWVLRWAKEGYSVRGCDFSTQVIEMARGNAVERGMSAEVFDVKSIYDLKATCDTADLIICCEVLEHLEDPHRALQALQRVTPNHLIISVPREPLWRVLNMVRGKYWGSLGNTPGHIQHWSSSGIVKLVSRYFEIVEVKSPLPWCMLLCRPLQ